MRILDNAEDRFEITGRGICFSAGHWKLQPGEWEPWDIRNETVLLNGVEVRIKGVEAFAIPRSPNNPYRHSFAVCISYEDAEKIPWKSLD